jgi:hypothetical protein
MEQAVPALGVSYGLTVLGSLGIVYAAGHLSASLIAGVLGVIALVLAMVCMVRAISRTQCCPPTRRDAPAFFVPVAVAAFFSSTNPGYSDYWGDEMNGLLRAIAVIAGRQETFFEHTKGPVEVLFPAVFGLLVGRFEPCT